MAQEKKLFSENSVFLNEYQANLYKQSLQKSAAQQISLLSGKIGSPIQGTGAGKSLLQQQSARLTQGPSARTLQQKQYNKKFKRLKKVIKDLIFVNAAICDEVVRVEEKVAKVKEERRFLLRKVLHYQSQSDMPIIKTPPTVVKVKEEPEVVQGKAKPKKKQEKKRPPTTKQILEGLPPPKPAKKGSKNQSTKKVIPPLQLDNLGRPVFPLVIGDLTIHSIGEIVYDRPGFHSVANIYPEGFCSTRLYVDVNNPDNRCLYTCKISDGGKGPIFEIASEENPNIVFCSKSISDCHNQLIKALKKNRKLEHLEQTGKGAEFFGISHPVIQNLVQSCPGAKRCTGYRWAKFEFNKSVDAIDLDTVDPTASYTGLKLFLHNGSKLPEPSSNLRSLLTNKALLNADKL